MSTRALTPATALQVGNSDRFMHADKSVPLAAAVAVLGWDTQSRSVGQVVGSWDEQYALFHAVSRWTAYGICKSVPRQGDVSHILTSTAFHVRAAVTWFMLCPPGSHVDLSDFGRVIFSEAQRDLRPHDLASEITDRAIAANINLDDLLAEMFEVAARCFVAYAQATGRAALPLLSSY